MNSDMVAFKFCVLYDVNSGGILVDGSGLAPQP